MREYFALHRSLFPSYLTIESGRMFGTHQYHCIQTQSPEENNERRRQQLFSVANTCHGSAL